MEQQKSHIYSICVQKDTTNLEKGLAVSYETKHSAGLYGMYFTKGNEST